MLFCRRFWITAAAIGLLCGCGGSMGPEYDQLQQAVSSSPLPTTVYVHNNHGDLLATYIPSYSHQSIFGNTNIKYYTVSVRSIYWVMDEVTYVKGLVEWTKGVPLADWYSYGSDTGADFDVTATESRSNIVGGYRYSAVADPIDGASYATDGSYNDLIMFYFWDADAQIHYYRYIYIRCSDC